MVHPERVCSICYLSGPAGWVRWAVRKGGRAQLLASCTLTSEWVLSLERFLIYQESPVACAALSSCAGMPLFSLSTGISGPQLSVFQTPLEGVQVLPLQQEMGCLQSHHPLRHWCGLLATGAINVYKGLDLMHFPLLQWSLPWVALTCLLTGSTAWSPVDNETAPCFTPFSVAAMASCFGALLGFCRQLVCLASIHFCRHSPFLPLLSCHPPTYHFHIF